MFTNITGYREAEKKRPSRHSKLTGYSNIGLLNAAIQKKHFAFKLMPKELLLKPIPDFEVKEPDKTWIPNYFQMMFTKYMPESRVRFFGIGGAL